MSILATPKINISSLDVPELRSSPSGPGKTFTQTKMKSAMNKLALSGLVA